MSQRKLNLGSSRATLREGGRVVGSKGTASAAAREGRPWAGEGLEVR